METKKTILIADTSEEFRTVLAEAIQAEEGLEVVGQTGDGQEAIQLVQDRDPDVLVMDLVLERMDGFDVLEAVKARPMSTLILSSFARGCMADQVAARGGDYYMMKPCRIASVVERVRLLAAQHWSEGEEGAASPASARQTLEANVTAIIHEIACPPTSRGAVRRGGHHHDRGGHGRDQRRESSTEVWPRKFGTASRVERAASATPLKSPGTGVTLDTLQKWPGFTVSSVQGQTRNKFIAGVSIIPAVAAG